MINNDTTTTKLTDNQVAQLEEFKSKLTNLESEISIANKNLIVLKKDIEKTVKDKKYQEELLAEATAKAEKAKKEITFLEDDVADLTTTKNNLLDDIKILDKDAKIKKIDLDNREVKIVETEKELTTSMTSVSKSITALTEDKKEFYAKVAKLKEVISTF